VKGRLVAGGHRLPRGDEDNGSPTVATEALLAVIGTAAALGHYIGSIDVETAYLEVPIDRVMHMRLDANLSDHLVDIDVSYANYRRQDGSITVELRKAL
jgi:hypothetical protein